MVLSAHTLHNAHPGLQLEFLAMHGEEGGEVVVVVGRLFLACLCLWYSCR